MDFDINDIEGMALDALEAEFGAPRPPNLAMVRKQGMTRQVSGAAAVNMARRAAASGGKQLAAFRMTPALQNTVQKLAATRENLKKLTGAMDVRFVYLDQGELYSADGGDTVMPIEEAEALRVTLAGQVAQRAIPVPAQYNNVTLAHELSFPSAVWDETYIDKLCGAMITITAPALEFLPATPVTVTLTGYQTPNKTATNLQSRVIVAKAPSMARAMTMSVILFTVINGRARFTPWACIDSADVGTDPVPNLISLERLVSISVTGISDQYQVTAIAMTRGSEQADRFLKGL